ncbi:MAG: SDR family oxidoreductase [Ktedonobacterales bacterium]|nr:SDR family oxidoreductase [Ktedonobacterales bacterium]
MEIALDGQIALVTGAGAGIGRGCALALAEAGATVLVNDIQAEAAAATVAAITQAGHVAHALPADIADAQAIAALFATLHETYGKLHILVNNAGFNLFKGIAATTPEEWDQVFAVDLRGLYLVTRAALPLLVAAQGAAVINIASVHAQLTIADITAYAAAKGGVVALGRSLAQELGPQGIRVNTISPGFVRTVLHERWLAAQPDPAAADARVVGYHPVGRIGTPADIGALTVFLASAQAGYITGANIPIDGGLSTRLMH